MSKFDILLHKFDPLIFRSILKKFYYYLNCSIYGKDL